MKNKFKNIAAAIMINGLFFVPVFCNAQIVQYNSPTVKQFNPYNQILDELKNDLIQIKGEIYALSHKLETVRNELIEVRELISSLQDIYSEVSEYDIFYVADLDRTMTKEELYSLIQNYDQLSSNLENQSAQLMKSIENLWSRYSYTMQQIKAIIKNQ